MQSIAILYIIIIDIMYVLFINNNTMNWLFNLWFIKANFCQLVIELD